MGGQTTFSVPTIVIAVIVLVAAVAVALMKYSKSKKNGENTDISDYYPNLIKAVQRAVSLLAINMDDFDNRDDYTNAVVSTAINYLKEDCAEFGIPADIIKLMDTNALASTITNLINENYYECFNVLDVQTISNNKPLLDKDFVACHCGVEGCVCNEGDCTCTDNREYFPYEETFNSSNGKEGTSNENESTFSDTDNNGTTYEN